MSDAIAFTVILKEPVSDEYAERIADATRLIHGVSEVTEHVADIDLYVAQDHARRELVEKLWEVLKA